MRHVSCPHRRTTGGPLDILILTALYLVPWHINLDLIARPDGPRAAAGLLGRRQPEA